MNEELLNGLQNPVAGSLTEQLMMGMTVEGVIASIIFGIIGGGYLSYAKKTGSIATTICGVVLIGYTFFVSETVWVVLIGVGVSLIPLLLNQLRKKGIRI